MDPLQPLPIEDWPLLQNLFKRDWPIYAQYYNWIDNAIKWKKADPNYSRKIYCPNGKYHTGVFVGISSATIYSVVLATFDENRDLLKKALIETNLIDWNQIILFSAIHEDVKKTLLEALDHLGPAKGVYVAGADTVNLYFKSKEECAKFNIKVPEECEIRHLDRSHIPLIHSLWPHRSQDYPEITTKFLESFVTLNRGIGLFLKKDNSLVSWILESDWGGLGMLQTVEEHKRKGYGKIVTEAIAKEIAVEENLDSILFVIDGNTPSEKLFASLGYKRFKSADWIEVKKLKNN